jgi:hypothetical protein
MATNTAPSPSFSGINFNPSFFSTSTSLTVEEADTLYLNKSVADTANVLETFTVGIATNALQATTASVTSLLSVDTIDSIGLSLTLGGASTTSLIASKNITLNTSGTLPIVSQLGYTVDLLSSSSSTTSSTINNVTNISSALIPVGTYIVHFEGQGSTGGVYNIGISTSSGNFNNKFTQGATCATAYNQNFTHPAMTVIIQNTSPTTWYLTQSSPTASYPVIRIYWYYTRIA